MWIIPGAYTAVFALTLLAFFLVAGILVPLMMHLLSRRLERRIVLAQAAFKRPLSIAVRMTLLPGPLTARNSRPAFGRPAPTESASDHPQKVEVGDLVLNTATK